MYFHNQAKAKLERGPTPHGTLTYIKETAYHHKMDVRENYIQEFSFKERDTCTMQR